MDGEKPRMDPSEPRTASPYVRKMERTGEVYSRSRALLSHLQNVCLGVGSVEGSRAEMPVLWDKGLWFSPQALGRRAHQLWRQAVLQVVVAELPRGPSCSH